MQPLPPEPPIPTPTWTVVDPDAAPFVPAATQQPLPPVPSYGEACAIPPGYHLDPDDPNL